MPQTGTAAPPGRWIEEAVLERAADAVGVAEIVDRRALGRRFRPPATSITPCAGGLELRPVSRPAGRSGWMLRAEQRLVRVDVADAGDPLLVEQERLHRRRATPRQRVQVGGGEGLVERLQSQPLARRTHPARPCPSAELAGPEAARVGEASSWPLERAAAPGRAGRPPAGSSSSVPVIRRCSTRIHLVLELPDQVLPATAEPLDAPARDRGGDARRAPVAAHQRVVEHLERAQRPRPPRAGASWRRIVSTSGSSGIVTSREGRRVRFRRPQGESLWKLREASPEHALQRPVDELRPRRAVQRRVVEHVVQPRAASCRPSGPRSRTPRPSSSRTRAACAVPLSFAIAPGADSGARFGSARARAGGRRTRTSPRPPPATPACAPTSSPRAPRA